MVIFISIIVSFAAVLLYLSGDIPVERFFYRLKGSDLNRFFAFVTEFGKAEYYLVPAAIGYLWFRKSGSSEAMQKSAYLFVTIAASGLLVDLIKVIAGRFRPELYFKEGLYGFDFFHISHNYLSFPSGHSATAMGAAIALGYLWPRWRLLFWIAGATIACSRMVVVRHYPSDVLIGGLIGALVSVWLYRRIYQKRMKNENL